MTKECDWNEMLKNGVGTDEKTPILFDANLTFINFDGNKRYCENKDRNDNQIINAVEAQAAVSLVLNIRKRIRHVKLL